MRSFFRFITLLVALFPVSAFADTAYGYQQPYLNITGTNQLDGVSINPNTAAAGNFTTLTTTETATLATTSGNVGIGTAAPLGTSALEVYGNHVVLLDPSHTPSAGTGTIIAGSTDNTGGVSGLSTNTSTVVTFGHTWDHTPRCLATNSTSAGAPYTSSVSATTVTFTFASTTGSIYYVCF